jgi:hypothetical protein
MRILPKNWDIHFNVQILNKLKLIFSNEKPQFIRQVSIWILFIHNENYNLKQTIYL